MIEQVLAINPLRYMVLYWGVSDTAHFYHLLAHLSRTTGYSFCMKP